MRFWTLKVIFRSEIGEVKGESLRYWDYSKMIEYVKQCKDNWNERFIVTLDEALAKEVL